MTIKVPKVGRKTIPAKEIQNYEERGWRFLRKISRTAWEITKRYKKWEKFEIKMRKLFKELQFEDCISDPEDFFYKELGPQIDVCGGVGKTFLVVDCTSAKEPAYRGLKEKIKDNYSKMQTVKDRIEAKYGNKYSDVVFAICTQDIQVKDKDKKYGTRKGVIIIDTLFFERCIKYLSAFGPSLKSHILKRLGGKFEYIEDGDPTKPYEYPCAKVKSGEKNLYSFTIEPETLLKLAYVYRLEEWMEDEKGYQRPFHT